MLHDVAGPGSQPLPWMALLQGIGFLVAFFLVGRSARSAGLPPRMLRIALLWSYVFAVLGQRLGWWLLARDALGAEDARFLSGGGGFFFGGLVLAALFFAAFTRWAGLPFWRSADAMYPLAIAQPLGRIGCFLDGCCFGRPTDLPWGIPSAWSATLHARGVDSLRIHPTQLYHVVADVALLLVLVRVARSRRFDGQVFLVYVLGCTASRFVIEFWRYDFELGLNVGGWISTNQLLAGLAFLCGCAAYFARSRPAFAVRGSRERG